MSDELTGELPNSGVTPPVTPPAATQPAEPILGKFKTQDELVRAYQELERKQSKSPAAKAGEMAIGTQTQDTSTGYVPMGKVIEGAGYDLSTVAQQYATTGDVPEEVMAVIRKNRPGKSDDELHAEARGELAQAELRRVQLTNIHTEAERIAGGENELKNLLAQARTFVPPHEVEALNKQLNDPITYKGALRTIMEYQAQHNGTDRSAPLVPGSGPPRPVGGYKTFSEWSEAINARARGRATPDQLARLKATDPAIIESANRPG